MKAAEYGTQTNAAAAFVATNSICQGEHVPILWPQIFATSHVIHFAHTSFKWRNLASHNAGVTVVIVGISKHPKVITKEVEHINAYLASGKNAIVIPVSKSQNGRALMELGNMPKDGGHLILDVPEMQSLIEAYPNAGKFIRRYLGSKEMIRGEARYCLWISDEEKEEALQIPPIRDRVAKVAAFRAASKAAETRPAAAFSHRFRQIQAVATTHTLVVPRVSSESRPYLPVGLLPENTIISDSAFALYDAPLWNLALIASRLHLVWIATVCGKLETRLRYSNTLGWNTFPIPRLTTKQKTDLTYSAEDILLARERHYPATIADLYAPGKMPADLAAAHECNDELIDRIYVGRRFKSDSDRLETLFAMYARELNTAQLKKTP